MVHKLLGIAGKIDALNERAGRFASWLVLIVVLLGAWNALARYAGRFVDLNLASNAYLELQWYLFSAIFLLGLGYTLKRDEHVRVDVMHASMRPRLIAKIDIAGTLVFLIPFTVFVLWASWFPVVNSWKIREMSPDPDGLPRYPIKTLVPIAFLLLLLQGVSVLIRRWGQMRNGECGSGSAECGLGNAECGFDRRPTFNEEDGSGSSAIQNPKSKIQNPDAGGIE